MEVMAKRRRNVYLASSHGGSSTPNHTSHQHYLTTREPVELLGSEAENLNNDKNDKENAEKDKPKRGPTMCYKVHRRGEEERLEITLNEHEQLVGPNDSTCNEFISFLGTIARKANILPLTIKNWPILRNEKKEELWDYVLKKDNKTTENPSLAQMFIATRKEKLTKRKPSDLRDKLMTELEKLDSEEEVKSMISTIIGSGNKKKSRLNFHGRGISSTQLKQKALMKEAEEKHAQEVQALQKDYEDKRQQDRREIAYGLSSILSQIQQQNPQMSFDLSMLALYFLIINLRRMVVVQQKCFDFNLRLLHPRKMNKKKMKKAVSKEKKNMTLWLNLKLL